MESLYIRWETPNKVCAGGRLHWLSVRERIHYKSLSATYQSVRGNTPLCLSDSFVSTLTTPLLTLSDQRLDIPLMFAGPWISETTPYGKRTFRYVAPPLWNVLSGSIKERDSIESFRSCSENVLILI